MDLKWEDLSIQAKNVVERCWSIHHDRPLTFIFDMGAEFTSGNSNTLPTEETYIEILKYQKAFPHFDISRIENRVIIKGNCNYGSW